MNPEIYSTPTRSRRTTICPSSSDLRSKYCTVQSRVSKDSKSLRDSNHWTNHEKRKENRISSLLKVRKNKLEEITGENRKIYVRINEQQSHYAYNGPQEPDKVTIKYKDQSNVLGPIGNWQPASCFISGTRGIMCESSLGLENIIQKPERKRLPSLSKFNTPEKNKENKIEQSMHRHLGSMAFTPNRNRNISDLYMLV